MLPIQQGQDIHCSDMSTLSGEADLMNWPRKSEEYRENEQTQENRSAWTAGSFTWKESSLLWAEVGLGPVEPVSTRFSASDYIAHSRNPAHHQSYGHSYVAKHDISSPAVGVAIAHIYRVL